MCVERLKKKGKDIRRGKKGVKKACSKGDKEQGDVWEEGQDRGGKEQRTKEYITRSRARAENRK